MIESNLGWVDEAYKFLGKKEIPGKATAPFIIKWLIELKAWWSDDETPWCGVAMGAWMKACNIPYPKEYYRAKSWLGWGDKISSPAYGAVVVFERKGGGHVGLVIGKDWRNRLLVLGGNQGDAVTITTFEMNRVAGYRWPPGQIKHYRAGNLPVYLWEGESSINEA